MSNRCGVKIAARVFALCSIAGPTSVTARAEVCPIQAEVAVLLSKAPFIL